MLEAFKLLREELTSNKPQVQVDQTSTSASKPGPSVSKDSVPRCCETTPHEEMEMDYGPALPPRLVPGHTQPSDISSSAAEVPSKKVSAKCKKHLHSHRKPTSDEGPVSDLYCEDSEEPCFSSTKPKKLSDKSRHKGRSRYYSSSSEVDQSSATKHRSCKPSGIQPSGNASDMDQLLHDPDPPYYREVSFSDLPSQYAEKVDTFRCILSLPDP